MSASGYIAVDLDGTLAHYDKWRGVDHIGEPVAPMAAMVKAWLKAGQAVKIFTARVAGHGVPDLKGGTVDAITPIEKWCEKHIGVRLPVTNIKDFGMITLYDDRAVQVEVNTGRLIQPT